MKSWTSWEIVRHQVAIYGLVKNEHGNVINGAQVNIVSMPTVFSNKVTTAFEASAKDWEDLDERVDRTVTNKNGVFFFMDLPNGPYLLNVIETHSGIQLEKKVDVARDKEGNIQMATMVVVLSLSVKK